MKEPAAYQAASAGQQTVESSGTASVGVPGGDRSARAESPRAKTKAASAPGLTYPRFFTEPGVDPFDEVEWELRSAVIGNERGEVVFDRSDGALRTAGVRFASLPPRALAVIARYVAAR